MKFTEYLSGDLPQVQESTAVKPPTEHTTVVQTQYYDADHQPATIYVKVNFTQSNGTVGRVQPQVVKWNGKIVPYDRFLQAIPELDNEALFEPADHLDTWSMWIV
jgi:hypothetical protein